TVTPSGRPSGMCSTTPPTIRIQLGIGVAARRRRLLRPSAWILASWILIVGGVVLHMPEGRPEGVTVFLSMSVFAIGGLVMPTIPMLLAMGSTWAALLAWSLTQMDQGVAQALPYPLFSLPIALAVYAARRQSLLASERHRLMELRLQEHAARAERLTRMSSMAGGVVHHFANLLTGVIAGTTLARDALEPGHPARPLLTEALDSGERAAALTARLGGFAGAHPLGGRRIEIDQWIDEAALHAENDTGGPLHLEIASGLPALVGDAEQLRDAVACVLRNAFEAASETGGEVRMAARRAGDPPGIRIEIEDEGPGIPQALLPHVFEPFFTSREPTRAGLGLSYAHGVVHAHGGSIQVDSQEGRGTHVAIWLPAGPSDGTPDAPTA
nr:ATP-binding protein [Myxococcota bacterium]